MEYLVCEQAEYMLWNKLGVVTGHKRDGVIRPSTCLAITVNMPSQTTSASAMADNAAFMLAPVADKVHVLANFENFHCIAHDFIVLSI